MDGRGRLTLAGLPGQCRPGSHMQHAACQIREQLRHAIMKLEVSPF